MNMSYMEIYNEGIYDLLPKPDDNKKFVGAARESLKLRESRHGQTFVRGLAKHVVTECRNRDWNWRNKLLPNVIRRPTISIPIRVVLIVFVNCEVSIESPIPASVTTHNNDTKLEEEDDDDDKSVSTANNGYNTDDEAALLTQEQVSHSLDCRSGWK